MYAVPDVDEVVAVAKSSASTSVRTRLSSPTCLMTAPRNHRPGTHLEAVEDNLMSASRGGKIGAVRARALSEDGIKAVVGCSRFGGGRICRRSCS
jgi:hypothetical protein